MHPDTQRDDAMTDGHPAPRTVVPDRIAEAIEAHFARSSSLSPTAIASHWSTLSVERGVLVTAKQAADEAAPRAGRCCSAALRCTCDGWTCPDHGDRCTGFTHD
jgi:hypothetical protein